MKYLSTIFICILLCSATNVKAEETVKRHYPSDNSCQKIGIPIIYQNNHDKGNHLLGTYSEKVVDSLANSLSYESDNETPFVFEPTTQTLITVKRGSSEPKSANYSEPLSKNNLFVLTSTDWGANWATPFRVYRASENTNLGGARYPSASGFVNKGELNIGVSFPLVD